MASNSLASTETRRFHRRLDAMEANGQVQLFSEEIGEPVIVVTTNLRHLARFVEARSWQEIDG